MYQPIACKLQYVNECDQNHMDCLKYYQSVKHFLGAKNQEIRIFFPQKSGGYKEFFSIKSNDFIQKYK